MALNHQTVEFNQLWLAITAVVMVQVFNHQQRWFNTRSTVRYNNISAKWEVMARGLSLMTHRLPLVIKLKNRLNMDLVVIRQFIHQVCPDEISAKSSTIYLGLYGFSNPPQTSALQASVRTTGVTRSSKTSYDQSSSWGNGGTSPGHNPWDSNDPQSKNYTNGKSWL